jgi:hypothetical protein
VEGRVSSEPRLFSNQFNRLGASATVVTDESFETSAVGWTTKATGRTASISITAEHMNSNEVFEEAVPLAGLGPGLAEPLTRHRR